MKKSRVNRGADSQDDQSTEGWFAHFRALPEARVEPRDLL